MKIRDEKGGSLIEFAVIAPMLFVIAFGIVEFGLLFYDKAMITNASREGARAGIVFDTPLNAAPLRMSGGVVIRSNVETKVDTVVSNYCGTHLISLGGASTVNVPPPVFQDENGDGIIESGDSLIVSVTYPYQFMVFRALVKLMTFSNTAIPGTINLTAETVMRFE
jgi:Flp pilus assembly protein TadG